MSQIHAEPPLGDNRHPVVTIAMMAYTSVAMISKHDSRPGDEIGAGPDLSLSDGHLRRVF